jgi:hypothetical protein
MAEANALQAAGMAFVIEREEGRRHCCHQCREGRFRVDELELEVRVVHYYGVNPLLSLGIFVDRRTPVKKRL